MQTGQLDFYFCRGTEHLTVGDSTKVIWVEQLSP